MLSEVRLKKFHIKYAIDVQQNLFRTLILQKYTLKMCTMKKIVHVFHDPPYGTGPEFHDPPYRLSLRFHDPPPKVGAPPAP